MPESRTKPWRAGGDTGSYGGWGSGASSAWCECGKLRSYEHMLEAITTKDAGQRVVCNISGIHVIPERNRV
jgi:hypothetical protein